MPTTLALPRPEVHVPLFGAFAPAAPAAAPVTHAPKHPEMLDTLPCSRPPHQVAAYTPAMSSVLHLFAISGAILLSQAAPAVQRMVVDTTLIMLLRPAAVEKVDPAVEKLREERAARVIVVANPPPVGFQTVAALAEIPKDIPPVDLSARPFDPKDFSGRGVEGGIAGGVAGGTGRVEDLAATHAKGAEPLVARVFTTAEVADPAQIVSQPAPEYPRIFASAGIGGVVVLQFVVDTLGRVEPGSVTVLEASHEPFAEAATKAIRASTFRPGRMRGEPIRQLVQQRVRFEAPEETGF
jgi:protein TonB